MSAILHAAGTSPYSAATTTSTTTAAAAAATTSAHLPMTTSYTPTATDPPTTYAPTSTYTLSTTTHAYPASTTTTTTTRKRKSDIFDQPATVPHVHISDDDPRLNDTIGWESCDQIRARIRTLIQSGTMRVGEFQATINCSAASYQRFMKQSGPEAGVGSDVYYGACRFFRKRELQGLHLPGPTKKTRHGGGGGDDDHGNDDTKRLNDLDVSGVTLPGEEAGAVRVHDTCDEVRRNIHALLRQPGIRQVDFLRAIAKSFPAPRKIQSKQLHDFLAKKGATAGNTSCVYYGAYVFFEKRRIRDGRPKSKMRLEMEAIHPAGMNTTDIMNIYVGPLGPVPVEDEYGRVISARPISRPLVRKTALK